MKLYSVDIKICATAYIRADSAEDALAKAAALKDSALELQPDESQEVPISGRQYNDPDLPDVSLSPAMSLYGPFDGATTAFLADDGHEASPPSLETDPTDNEEEG